MRFFAAFLFLLFSQFNFAQYIHTKTLTTNNGLISNNIQACFVDSDGNLWLGSRAGLSVKSGNSFKNATQAATYKFNNIYDIIEDPYKGKWIAGYGQGILYFNQQNSKLINEKSGLVSNIVRSVFYHDHKIYAGTLNGISIISTKDFSITNPKFTPHTDYLFSVTSFFTVNNKVYATTLNNGVYEVTKEKLIKVSDLKKGFSSIVHNGKLYISTQDNLYEINPVDFKIINTFNIPSVHRFLSVNNDLYLISSGIFENKGGLFQLKNNEIINKTSDFYIPFSDFKSLAFDFKNKFLYVGTHDNGLVQTNLNAPVFYNNTVKETFTINATNKQQYVFHDQGFSIFQNNVQIKKVSLQSFKKFQQQHANKFKKHTVIENHFYPLDYDTPAEKIVFYSSQIYKNEIWAASNIGIFQLNFNGKIVSYHPVHIYYFTFFQDKLFTVVPYAGVRVFHDIHKMDYSYFHDWENPDVPAEIVSVAKTNDAIYFASALSGLYQYKNDKFRSLLLDKSFTEPKLKRICTTANGKLVAVTDYNDVYVLDVSKPKVQISKRIAYDKIKGNTTNFVHEVNGILYIATNLGLNVFYGDKYFFIDQAQGFTNYSTSTATVTNNKLFITTKNGFFVLNNDYFLHKRSFDNTIIITDVFVNNKRKAEESYSNNQMKLAYNENNIRLNFQVKNAKYPDKLQFKFRLKPSEPWQELTTENQLSLNYLNNGFYKVELQIINEDTGTVSYKTLLNLTINPPFYYSWWFVAASLLFVIGSVFSAYKIRINFIKQKQTQKLAVITLQNEQEKKELLFDKQLADIKLQALKSQMNSHFLFNVLSSIQYYIICKDIDSALYYLERFSALVRTTLEYSDKKDINLYDEIAYLKQYIEIENLRTEHPIVFKESISENVDSTQIKIVPLLLQPFIENAIVHAFTPSILNPQIELKIENTDDSVKISIVDNGIGYQQKTSAHQSKGISIAQSRLDLTQKKLQKPIEIHSSNKGTQVVIYL